ncbi:hypothetical protein HU675_0028850 [Bradyrhizobium septentrionale]|uniref:hypothetical protein n=1 Tax=Bradyrhizobium septentrionale TaxID=1404411 RepID=UPI001596B2A2|nr:hypothetical protein [Bradyrhizobium septentrionale]UGY29917.1 hypothetical protein HU675_0028850 [Bradyrhizobium septentrionale]
MTFISGAPGNSAHEPKVKTTLASLGGPHDLQPSDFSAGGATGTGHTGAGGQTPDPESKVKGGLTLDDPHGQKTVESVFKPHG